MNRQYFDFSSLITDYSNPFTVLTYEQGSYDEKGEYAQGQPKKITMTGAIISFRESKVFRSEGAITAKDRRLFTQSAIPAALIGAEVIFKGQKYMIESELENAEFTGVWSYHLKWVSAFDRH